MRIKPLMHACVLAVTGASAGVANAQPDWQPVFEFTGLQGTVYDSQVIDLGTGERLVVAGEFIVRTSQGNVRNLAVWDGTCWSALGGSFDGEVNSLEVYQGELFAAGNFSSAGNTPASAIARWTGSGWEAPGGGTDRRLIRLMIAHEGELVAFGSFDVIGGVPSEGEAAWNGSTWRDLPGDVSTFVQDAASFNGSLFVCGAALRLEPNGPTVEVGRFDGTGWTEFVSTGNGQVRALEQHDDRLVVAGGFGQIGGQPISNLAQWDGLNWSTVGPPALLSVQSVASAGGNLHVTQFRLSPSDPVGIGVWDGNAWTRIPSAGFPLAELNGRLVSGGTSVFDGSTWKPLVEPFTASLTGLFMHERRLIASGQFPSLDVEGPSGVAELRGRAWLDLAGLGSAGGLLSTSAPAAYMGDLVAAGFMNDVFGIARHHAGSWEMLGAVTRLAGPIGSNHVAINDFAVLNDELIVVGSIDNIDGVPIQSVAAWDGLTWRSLGPVTHQGQPVYVVTAHVLNNTLYVAGTFPGGVTPQPVVMQFDGESWFPIGTASHTSSFGISVNDLTDMDGELVAGGYFSSIGGVPARSLARWNGLTWREFDGWLPGFTLPTINAMHRDASDLYVTGQISSIGGVSMRDVARWNGQSWSAVVNPTNSTWVAYPRAVAVHRGETYVDVIHRQGPPAMRTGARAGPAWCPADYSGSADPSHPDYLWPDGVVDAADFMAYIDLFAMNHPVVDTTSSSDPSDCRYAIPDGIVDLSDFFHFLDRFVEPCP